MVEKRLLCPNRRRRTPAQFSWLDHRLMRERRLESCPLEAWALDLFLVTVGDAQGLSYYSDASLNPAARNWLDSVANVRVHGETHKRPLDLFALERDQLRPLPELLYDIGAVHTVRASNRFRVTFDTNRYSVPAEYASQRLTLKSYPDRLCIYHHDRLLARHPRSYERHRDFEHPDHPRALLEQRRKATTQRLLQRFVSLSPRRLSPSLSTSPTRPPRG